MEWLRPLLDSGILLEDRVREVQFDYLLLDGKLCRVGRFPDEGTVDELKTAILHLVPEIPYPQMTVIVNGHLHTPGPWPWMGTSGPVITRDIDPDEHPHMPTEIFYNCNPIQPFILADGDRPFIQ